MRTVKKSKPNKKKKQRRISNIPATIKNQIMTKNYLIEMQNNVIKDLCNASLILALAGRYLKKHREAWDKEDAYLKPYLKGLLTKIVHQFGKFEDKLETGIVDKLKDDLHETLSKNMEEDFAKYEDFDATNYEIFETFALAGVCVRTVKERLINLKKNSKKTAEELEEALKIYKRYMEFWETEIDIFNVSFQK